MNTSPNADHGRGHGNPGHGHDTVTVVVNGRQKVVPKNDELTFHEVVALAFETPPTGDGVQFTIQYTRGHGHKPTGTLLEGQSVKPKDGMEFDVTATNRS